MYRGILRIPCPSSELKLPAGAVVVQQIVGVEEFYPYFYLKDYLPGFLCLTKDYSYQGDKNGVSIAC